MAGLLAGLMGSGALRAADEKPSIDATLQGEYVGQVKGKDGSKILAVQVIALGGKKFRAVGYAGGYTPNANYREVCSGETGHTEAVRVVYDPTTVSFESLLKTFWENHDPTQGMRQGNDAGTQYRSAIYCDTEAQYAAAIASRDAFQSRLAAAGHGAITTEILHPAPVFYYAEEEHQQYLSKHPGGYCGLGGTGVSCPIGLGED